MVSYIDISIACLLSLGCLVYNYYGKGLNNKKKVDFVKLFINSFLMGFAFYSGFASFYLGVNGKQLFGLENIISQNVIAIFGGITLMGLSMQQLLKKN